MPQLTHSHFIQQRSLWVVILVLVVGLTAYIGAVAQAATITVNSLGDPGDGSCNMAECTLREAIAAASAGDTIDFSVSGTIILNGNRLYIDKGLTISGPGASQLVIDANGRSGVLFLVNEGRTESFISGVTITGGVTFSGGGIANDDGILTLTDCVITGNVANWHGGGVYVDTPVTMINCVVSDNVAGLSGGGIWCNDNLVLSDSVVSDNTSGGVGGGIAYSHSYLNTMILRSIISNNKANTLGGGIYNESTVLPIINGTVNGNDATYGGGIYNYEGTLTLTDSIVNDNMASREGGGIVDRGGDNYSYLTTIHRTTISNNRAEINGGGILKASQAKMTITMSTIADNSVLGVGGGIFNDLVNGDQPIDIINSTITGNSASHSGGIAIDGGPVLIENSTIAGNNATIMDGGIGYCCDAIIVNTIIALNTAPDRPDCGIYSGTSLGNNIIGDTSGCGIALLSSDMIGNPGLGPFFDPGIPGQGHIPLLPTSPAIDSCNDYFSPPTDQLGISRPQDGDDDGFAICDIGSYEYVQTFIDVSIDVKPGGFPNSINLKSKGKVPVAILSTDDFDAYNAIPDTVSFAGADPLRWTMEDIDKDGDYDMLLHFNTQELELAQNSVEATLEGETYDGSNIIGTDSVKIVPKIKFSQKGKKVK